MMTTAIIIAGYTSNVAKHAVCFTQKTVLNTLTDEVEEH